MSIKREIYNINIYFFFCFFFRISTDWIGLWAQLARFYSPILLPLVFAIYLHCFAKQLKEKQYRNAVPSTLSCLLEMPIIKLALIPEAFSILLGYCLLPSMQSFVQLLSVVVTKVVFLSRFIDSLHLPKWPPLSSDEFILRSDGLGFPFMYLLLGIVAWSLAIILSLLFWLGVSTGGNILHTLIIR